MKVQHVLVLAVTVLAASPARSERTLWTETATIRTKTIFGDDGSLRYQQNWDKRTGKPVGRAVELSAEAAPAPAPIRTFAHQAGALNAAPPMGTPPWGAQGQGYAPSAPQYAPPPQYAPSPTYPATPAYRAPTYAQGGGWIQGPFQAAPMPVAPRLQVGANGSRLQSPEGRENPHPEWSRLYHEAQAPLPERDGYSLPPPPPMYPVPGGTGQMAAANGEPPLVGRPMHPDIPGQGNKRWFNRVGGKVLMRPDNMVRVKVLDRMSSKRNKRGDTFRYVLLDPIMYGLRTLVPAGTKGMGRVGRSKSRGFFGRPGLLDLEFGSVDLPGATPARIYLAETVISPEPREPEALGGAAVGLLAFGPLGVAGGALIRGHDVRVQAGSVFHVEVAVDVPYMHTASR